MSSKICPQMMSTIDAQNQDDQKSEKGQVKQCRICLQQTFPLIIPCKCDGTVKHVHQSCLTQWANELVKKKLKQQQQEGVYETVTSIQCQLCKQNIKIKIEWTDVSLTFSEAKQREEQFFWPVLIVNILIGVICLTSITFAIVVLAMVVSKNPNVDYERFQSQPLITWGTLSAALVVGVIFIFKSIKDLHSIFVKKQFHIQGLTYKQIVNPDKNQSNKHHTSDIVQIKSFTNLKTHMQAKRHSNVMLSDQIDNHHSNANFQQQQSDINLFCLGNERLKSKGQKLPPLPRLVQAQ